MFTGTTIIAVDYGGEVALAGDGQVTMGEQVMKHGACKVRRLYQGSILAGFAGTAADAFTLFEKFEGRLEEYGGNLQRSAVELAKEWRTDKVLRRLEALLITANLEDLLLISGSGDVIAPDDGVLAIGSGGAMALAAARAMVKIGSQLSAAEIARTSLEIAADICIYTNREITVEVLESKK